MREKSATASSTTFAGSPGRTSGNSTSSKAIAISFAAYTNRYGHPKNRPSRKRIPRQPGSPCQAAQRVLPRHGESARNDEKFRATLRDRDGARQCGSADEDAALPGGVDCEPVPVLHRG